MVTIIADIGGTKTRIATTSSELLSPVRIDTSQSYAEGLATLVRIARELSNGQPIEQFIAGVPGVLDTEHHMLLNAPHLQGWNGMSLVDDLQQQLGCSVVLQNDTALVGLGEAHYGSGRGSRIMMYLTISTGVNGVRIVDGHIDTSAQGFEVGGQYLSHGDILETFEELVSGTSIERRHGKRPKELGMDSPVWEDLARITAIGIHNTILEWSPDTVVLGGSMFNTIGINVDRVRAHLTEIMHKFLSIPRIEHSALKDDGGLYGGLALSKSQIPISG
jgi:predicted NBD/HSP70 family sugar kinase